MRYILLAMFASAVLVAEPAPQTPAAADTTFEVVSIKPNKAPGPTRFGLIGGRYTMERGPVTALIRIAYPADTNELVGAPEWVRGERYDVTAIAKGDPTREQLAPMMRAMLADRFKLKAHYETQERPTFSLVRSRADGQLGPQIRRSPLDCAAVAAANRAGRPVEGPSPGNGAPRCGMSFRAETIAETLLSGGVSMADFARSISGSAGRMVIDKTGLEGPYEFTLTFSTRPESSDARADDAPSIFTALQEQLGLKLEPDRAPLRVIVIDQIERPTEN